MINIRVVVIINRLVKIKIAIRIVRGIRIEIVIKIRIKVQKVKVQVLIGTRVDHHLERIDTVALINHREVRKIVIRIKQKVVTKKKTRIRIRIRIEVVVIKIVKEIAIRISHHLERIDIAALINHREVIVIVKRINHHLVKMAKNHLIKVRIVIKAHHQEINIPVVRKVDIIHLPRINTGIKVVVNEKRKKNVNLKLLKMLMLLKWKKMVSIQINFCPENQKLKLKDAIVKLNQLR